MSGRHSVISVLLLLLIAACNVDLKQKEGNGAGKFYYSEKGTVRELMISPDEVALPQGEGKREVETYCSTCHSLRYITSQPLLTEDKWREEVKKMAVDYKAPVPDEAGEKIISYIMRLQRNKH